MGSLAQPLHRVTTMDTESAQVSRLLELAAAMSSAQEKATGNGKLDMAGIMAALALAQKEEKDPHQREGQNSFLHGSYQRDSSSLVRAEYVKETTFSEESEVTENRKVEREERKKSFLYNNETVKRVERNQIVRDVTDDGKCGSSVTGIHISSKKSTANHVQNKGLSNTGERLDTKMANNENESFLHNNGRQVDVVLKDKESGTFGRKVAGYKAAFESMNSDSSLSSSNENSPPSYKKHETTAKTENVKKLNNESGKNESSAPLLLASSQNIAKFLTKQQTEMNSRSKEKDESNEEGLEERERITGIGNREAFFESSGNTINQEGKKTIQPLKVESQSKNEAVITHKVNTMKTQPSLPDLLDSSDVEVYRFLATVSTLSAEKEKKTGNGKLDMAELAAALSAVTKSGTSAPVKHVAATRQGNGSISTLSQDKRSNTEIFNKKKFSKTESSVSLSSSSSTRSEFMRENTSLDTSPSSLANAKTSFLQSIITQASAGSNDHPKEPIPTQGRKDMKNSAAFIPEKNSVISELKNIINDDPVPVLNMPKRSFNAVPKGFQAPDLSGTKPTADSQISGNDPLVKKLVYNQYREMLKSYTSSNQ